MATKQIDIKTLKRDLENMGYDLPNYSPVYNRHKGQLFIKNNLYNQYFITDYIKDAKKKGITPQLDHTTLERSFYDELINKAHQSKNIELKLNVLDPDAPQSIKGFWQGTTIGGASNTLNAMQHIDDSNARYIYFDTETIGDAKSKNWFITEMSFYKQNKKTGEMVSTQMFFRPEENQETKQYIEELFQKVETNLKKNADGLTKDERRSLLSLTDITLGKDNQIVSKKIGYDATARIDEKILKQAKEGYNILNTHGTSLADKKGLSRTLENILGSKNSKVAKNIMVGHNIEMFDIPGFRAQFGNMFSDRLRMDTYSLAKLVLGDDKTIHGYTMDDLAKHYGIVIDSSKRHIGSYDTMVNQWIHEKLIQDYRDKFGKTELGGALKQYSTIQSKNLAQDDFMFKPLRNFYRADPRDAMYLSNSDGTLTPSFFKKKGGKMEVAEDLYSHKLVDVNSSYRIDKTFKDGDRWFAQLTNVDTGDITIFGKETKEELTNQLDEMFGGYAQKFKLKGPDELLERNFNSMFHSSRGYYNLNTMTQILDQVEEKLGGNIVDASEESVRQAIKDISGFSDERINKFLSMYPELGKHKNQLNSILKQVDNLKDPSGNSLSELQKSSVLASAVSKYGQAEYLNQVKLSTGDVLDFENGDLHGKQVRNYITAQMKKIGNPRSQDYRHAYKKLVDELTEEGVIDKKQQEKLASMVDDFFVESAETGRLDGKGTHDLGNKIAQEIDGYRYGLDKSKRKSKPFVRRNVVAFKAGMDNASILDHIDKNIINVGKNMENTIIHSADELLTASQLQSMMLSVAPDAYNDKATMEILRNISNEYSNRGIGSFTSISNSGDSLEMLLFDMEKANNIFEFSNENIIIKDSNVARVQIPLSKDGVIQYKNQKKINGISYKFIEKNGDLDLIEESKQEEILKSIQSKIGYTSSMIKEGNVLKAEKSLNNAMFTSFSASSAAGTFFTASDDAVKHTFNGVSPGQDWLRRGIVDISGAVEEALIKHNGGPNVNVKDKITSFDIEEAVRYVTYRSAGLDVENMTWGKKVQNVLSGEKNWLNLISDKLGHVSTSIKAEAMKQGKIAIRDARDLVSFGALTSGSKEYFTSVLNHLMIDTDSYNDIVTKRRLGDKTNDLFRKVLSTKTYMEVYGDALGRKQFAGLEVNSRQMTDAMIKEFYEKDGKNLGKVIPGIYGDTALMKRSVADSLYTTRLNQVVLSDDITISEDFEKFLKDTVQKQKNNGIDEAGQIFGKDMIVGGIQENDNADLKKVIKVGENDVFMGFGVNEKGQTILKYKQYIDAKDGSKILTSRGLRATIRIIGDDDFDALAKYGYDQKQIGKLSLDNIGIIQAYSENKTTNITDNIGGRIEYIMGASIDGVDNKEKDRIIQKYLKSNGIDTINGKKVFEAVEDENGNIVRWVDNLEVADVEGANRITEKQRKALVGLADHLDEQLGIDTVGLGRSTVMLPHLYEWHHTIGAGSKEFLERNSPLRYGIKEIMSIEDSIAMVTSLGERPQEYEDMIVKRLNYAGKNPEMTKMIKSLMMNSDSLNGTDSKVTGKVLDIGISNIQSEYREGGIKKALTNGGLSFSEVYGGQNVKGLVEELDYDISTMGRVRKAAEDAGADYVRVKLPTTVTIKDGNVEKQLDNVVIPILKKNYVDGNIIPGQVEGYMGDLFDTIDEFNNATTVTASMRDQLSTNVSRIIGATGEVFNKDSEIFKGSMGFRVGNAGAYTMTGVNATHYLDDAPIDFGNGKWQLGHKSFENTVVINPEDLKDQLKINYKQGTKDYDRALTNLKWEYQRLSGEALDDAVSEDDVINKIVKYTDISNNIEAGTGNYFMGLSNRQPSIDQMAAQNVYIRTSSEIGRGNMLSSLGVEKFQAADHDGDTGYLWFEMADGKYASQDDYVKAAQQKQTMIERQKSINQIVGTWIAEDEKAGKIVNRASAEYTSNLDKVVKNLSDDQAQAFISQQARYGKSIGSISNASFGMRQALYDVGMLGNKSVLDGVTTTASDRMDGVIVSEIMKMMEQNTISSKHLEKQLAGGQLTQEVIDEIINNQKKTVSAIKNENWDQMFDLLKERNLVTHMDGVGDVVKGANADNILAINKVMGYEEGLWNGDVDNRYITVDRVKESFEKVSSRVRQLDEGSKTLNSYFESVRFGRRYIDFSDSAEILNTAKQLQDRSGGVEYSRVAQNMMADIDDTFGDAVKNTDIEWKSISRTSEMIGDGLGGGSAFSRTTYNARKMASNAADTFMDTMKGIGSKTGGIALAAGAIWAGSAMIRPPRVDQTPAADEEQYYDPGIAADLAAGAPMGAGPRAHLAHNPQVPYQINIRGNSLNNLTNAQISGILETEMYNQAGLNVNFNIKSAEDKNSYDRSWFDKKISAMF